MFEASTFYQGYTLQVYSHLEPYYYSIVQYLYLVVGIMDSSSFLYNGCFVSEQFHIGSHFLPCHTTVLQNIQQFLSFL